MSLTRRKFLEKSAIGGAVVAAGVTMTSGCGNDVIAAPVVTNEVEFDDEASKSFGQLRLRLTDPAFNALRLVGGALTVRIKQPVTPENLRPFKLPDPPHLLVIHRGEIGERFEYIAVDSACPHAGCPLGYSAEQKTIMCPCHSSQFRAEPAGNTSCVGEVMHAPAQQGPTPYQAALDPADPSTLVIDMRLVDDCGTVRLPPIVSGKIAVPLADYPMLAQSGGSVIGRPAGSAIAIAVVRLSDATDASAFAALSAVCTHLGCTISYGAANAPTSCGTIGAGGGFWCKCHCSQFGLDGSVLVGPANKPLPKYGAAFDGTTLTITIT
ncbi:MAG: Rieske (2Fe-2S) domain protein [Myxococcales bacterium]|nr:Rieske (2Fe-2S) domain protein [Myxococcales bacterium]